MNSNQPPYTPAEAFKEFFSSLSGSDVLWLILSLAVATMVFYFALYKWDEGFKGYQRVILWIAVILIVWAGTFIIFGRFRISEGGSIAYGYGGVTLLLAVIGSLMALNSDSNWPKIISGTIFIVVCFFIWVTFGIGLSPYSYSIFYGATGGLFIGRFLYSIKIMNNSHQEESFTDDGIDRSEPTEI